MHLDASYWSRRAKLQRHLVQEAKDARAASLNKTLAALLAERVAVQKARAGDNDGKATR